VYTLSKKIPCRLCKLQGQQRSPSHLQIVNQNDDEINEFRISGIDTATLGKIKRQRFYSGGVRAASRHQIFLSLWPLLQSFCFGQSNTGFYRVRRATSMKLPRIAQREPERDRIRNVANARRIRDYHCGLLPLNRFLQNR
jgi:hypothetical protein